MPLPDDVRIGVDIAGDATTVVVSLRGELDAYTAPDVTRLVAAAVEGRSVVVLDAANLEFCSAAGLRIIADLATRLDAVAGTLELRSASATLRRLLEITGVDELVTLAPAGASDGQVGVRSPLARDLGRALEPVAWNEVVAASTRLVARLARLVVPSSAAASVTLRRPEGFVTIAASDTVAIDLDETQYDAGSGPCIDAASTGSVQHADLIGATSPWPHLQAAATSRGISGVLSVPVVADAVPVAALNLYSHAARFDAVDLDAAHLLAEQAATLFETHTALSDELIERLADGLTARDVIAQAQGIVMERDRIGPERAFVRLGRDAAARGLTLRALAAEVVESASASAPTSCSDRELSGR